MLAPPGEDCGYAEFIASIDAIVMGRNTFELIAAFPQWPFGELPLVVLSRSLDKLPPGTPATVSLSSQPPAELAADLASRGLHQLYVDGGLTIQSFLSQGLIDEITIPRIPLLLGSGKSLFGSLPADIWLEHSSTRIFDFGFVQSTYRVINSN